jgi:hypothetical protein
MSGYITGNLIFSNCPLKLTMQEIAGTLLNMPARKCGKQVLPIQSYQ